MGPEREERGMTHDDLLLLLQTYENMSKPLTELLNMSSGLVENLETIVTRLDQCSQKLTDIGGKIEKSLSEGKGQCKLDHQSLGFRIHLAWIASAGVVVAVLGLAYKVVDSLGDLDKLQLIERIAQHMGLT